MTTSVAIVILIAAAMPIGFVAVITYIGEKDRARARAAMKGVGLKD